MKGILISILILVLLIAAYPGLVPVFDTMIGMYDAAVPGDSAFNRMVIHTSPIWAPILLVLLVLYGIVRGAAHHRE